MKSLLALVRATEHESELSDTFAAASNRAVFGLSFAIHMDVFKVKSQVITFLTILNVNTLYVVGESSMEHSRFLGWVHS